MPSRDPDRPRPPAPPSGTPAPVDPPLGPPAIHAPWRHEYLRTLDAGDTPQSRQGTGSFLLDDWRTPERDVQNHVVVRTSEGIILLNKYPYAGGHLLVALGEARPSLLDYSADQRAALWRLVDVATDLMQRTLEPQGINIGINQGRAAGAGVPQHLHVHLVPRWGGDVNFMQVVGQVKVIASSLDAMATRYRETWASMRGASATG
jgi:ATP adenylyltransferase